MALLLIDSFDAYGTNDIAGPMKWSGLASFYPLQVGRRPGGRCLTTQAAAVLYLDTAVADWAMGFAFYWQGDAPEGIAYGQIGGYVSPHRDWDICVDVLGQLYFREWTQGGDGLWRATSTLFMTSRGLVANAWNYIELKQDGSTATARINGNTVGAGSLASGAQNGFGLFEGSPYNRPAFDDFYLLSIDAETPDFLGDTAIEAYVMASDDTAEWTPKTGSDNYAMVDEIPSDEDGTYNHTDAANKTDLFQLDPAGITDLTLEVFGLQLTVRAEKVNSASVDLAPLVVSGTTESLGTQWGLPVGYSNFRHALATNPDTSAAWTVEEILAAKYGYRSLAPAG